MAKTTEAKGAGAKGKAPAKSAAKAKGAAASGSGAKAPARKAAAGGKPNALQQPLQPSKELAAVVGAEKLSRGEVVKKVWAYIHANNLQNPENKREIIADDKLRQVFGRDRATMFEMNKYLSQHLA
ncbi:MAG: hypothetical protein J0H67_14630 [Rhodospirillales bacterium]|nr:hypothetical protein [Rhodospirillales bacterium]